jgi:hypothetical protein
MRKKQDRGVCSRTNSRKKREIIRKWGVDSRSKRVEFRYWLTIGQLRAEGVTQEQAREKMYDDQLDKGDIEGRKLCVNIRISFIR